MADIERHSAHDALAERLYDAEARIGQIIFLPAAHDGDTAIQLLEDFILDDLAEDHTALEFERKWPGFRKAMARWYNDKIRDRREQVAVAIDLIQSRCPMPYLIRVEYTIKECIGRSADDTFPCGTWRGGWGYYSTQWILAGTVEEACERVIELADAQRRKTWDAFSVAKVNRTRKGKAADI